MSANILEQHAADTADRIKTLPKWAQDHIRHAERCRDEAVKRLQDFQDAQTVSPVYYEEWALPVNGGGPIQKRCYVQSERIVVETREIELTASMDKYGIRLQWVAPNSRSGDIAFIPESYQQARLVAKRLMRE